MRLTLDDSRVVDTNIAEAIAEAKWDEDCYYDGNNWISRATGSQWYHETLYLSRKGTWYVVHTSNVQGTAPRATVLSTVEAARWLIHNGHALPETLQSVAEEAVE